MPYWRKPLTLMYDHNYKYGTNLYTGALDDVERKYRQALFRTHLTSDRPYYGSYLSYYTPSKSYWPTTTLRTAPRRKSYYYYDIPYYSQYSSPYYYSSYYPYYSSYYQPYKYYRPYSSSYYSSYYPYYYDYYYHTPYTSRSYLSPYWPLSYDYGLYDIKRSKSDPNLRRSFSVEDLDYKKTDDYWVPLSSYLYRSPSATDFTDYDLKTSKKRWKELDDLEWQLKSGKLDSYDAMYWADKCKEFQSKLDTVTKRMNTAEELAKSEAAVAQKTLKTELSHLSYRLKDSNRENDDFIKIIKDQEKDLADMKSKYKNVYHLMNDAADYIIKSKSRCDCLQNELDELLSSVGTQDRIIRTTTYVY